MNSRPDGNEKFVNKKHINKFTDKRMNGETCSDGLRCRSFDIKYLQFGKKPKRHAEAIENGIAEKSSFSFN